MLKRVAFAACAIVILGAGACQPAPFNPEDPAVIATIDSLLKNVMEGAAAADADRVLAFAEGTYTDKAGWTSDPVGIGTTIVFVKEDGQWRARHAHQSVVR